MRYALVALAVVSMVGLLYGLHTKAVRDARQAGATQATLECLEAIDNEIRRQKQLREGIEYRNAKKPDSDIDNALRADWLRTDG